MSEKEFDKENLDLNTIVNYCKRKGFVYPSSDIYGGYAATYDFGPLGVLLKNNIFQIWRKWNVTSRPDVVEIEGAIFMHPKVWEASGHIGGFADLMVEDSITHKRFRADHLLEETGAVKDGSALTPEQVDDIVAANNIVSPDGNPLSKAKRFNLLVKTHLGPIEDESTVAYLKGEACQNIYLNFKNVLETTRKKLPFGIAQIGKAFRNEITVKQFILRMREFEQMDVQYFCHPSEADQQYENWKQNRQSFYTDVLKLSPENIRMRQHGEDERAFYASDAWDVEYKFGELGFKEIEGLHHRGSYDLDQHAKFSGKDLSYLDVERGNLRYNPYIVECSAGFTRIFLAILFENYFEEEVDDANGNKETRIVLKFPYNLAPFKLAILPLMKKDGMKEKAESIYADLLAAGISVDYDEAGSIGKRYRRQDESGTPWCLTVDHQALEDDTVTLRHRDTMEQVGDQGRVSVKNIKDYLNDKAFEG
ncbi:glycine--tRNA ligase [Candidatus Peregrinibacteria bacterium]|nr:glycine--tRNA ligase [Candidatus Peregrinibacteria bacterium]